MILDEEQLAEDIKREVELVQRFSVLAMVGDNRGCVAFYKPNQLEMSLTRVEGAMVGAHWPVLYQNNYKMTFGMKY